MSCTSSRSVFGCSPGPGFSGTSGSFGSLTSSAAESMRTPATPRSNQNFSTSSCSRRTSGWFQLRSGCSGVNRCRYHSPGCLGIRAGPGVALEVRDPVVRHLVAVRALARAEPEALALRRAGAGRERGLEPRMLVEMWLGTTSMIVRMPSASASLMSVSASARCRTRGGSRGSRHVVAAVGERRRVPRGEPDGVDAEIRRYWSRSARRRCRRCRHRCRRRSCGCTPGRSRRCATTGGSADASGSRLED